VAKIEALAVKINEVRKIQHDLEEKYNGLCRSLIFDKFYGGPVPTPMSELISLKEPDVVVFPEENYHFADVYCFGRGVFIGDRRNGFEFAYKKLTQLRTGDLVYPKLMAWEGAISIVPHECDGLFVSPEFPVFKVKTDLVFPEVLDVYFRTPAVWPLLAGTSTGTNVRRRRLKPKDFLKHEFPLPPIKNQYRLQKISSSVNDIRHLQTQTATELDALLPAILDRAFKGKL
jgi:type I restriction enzyme, S subunit